MLSHLTPNGELTMVDVANKLATIRTARAVATVLLGEEAYAQVSAHQIKKGDVLTVAQIAGIQAAKQTHLLIPLCHSLLLQKIEVTLQLNPQNHSIGIESLVKCSGETGVEMEALTAVSVAALTVYDMCKAVNKSIEIVNIKLLSKTGGKSDYLFKESA